MRYISTRGQSPSQSFLEILLGGLAPDGGLYLPESYPQISAAELTRFRSLSYAELAFEILSRFATDIPTGDLKALVERTYTGTVYCHGRDPQRAAEITPLFTIEPVPGKPLKLQALSNGPTLAFKDMAMQLLGNLFEYALQRNHSELNILGATSGDTGSAAEYAMRGKRGVRVFMLSPQGKMSAFQTAQMFSLQDENIHNIAVRGVFDDCQDMVKAVSNDLDFKERYRIGTVNSINWARVVAQVIYYFKGYLAATTDNHQQVSFTVPSGNFGNICAGHIARQMGLPIRHLVVATNENDVLDEFFRTGIYRVRKSADTLHTSSPSMDISKASNFERFIFDLLGRNGERVRTLFQQVETKGIFDLSGKLGSDGNEFAAIKPFGFQSGKSTHENRLATIRQVYQACHWVIDPHTADGVKVALEHQEAGIPMIVLETALPAKFGETIQEALGIEPPRPADLKHLEDLPQRFEVLEASGDAIKHLMQSRLGR